MSDTLILRNVAIAKIVDLKEEKMASTIKSTRRAAGISVNELAQRLGVTPSAISQLERSEAEGTIKLNSLRDALAAMGANLRLTAGAEGRKIGRAHV